MGGVRAGPVCGLTNSRYRSTPGCTGHRDPADPVAPLYIPDKPGPFGSPSDAWGSTVTRFGEEPADHLPGQQDREVFTAVAVKGKNGKGAVSDYTFYRYNFAKGTSLADALTWIFDHSRHTRLRGLQEHYREITLYWNLNTKAFAAWAFNGYTEVPYIELMGTVNDSIMVAHTHPTPKELKDGGGIDRGTHRPSAQDRNLIGRCKLQRYTIIVHRDSEDNKTPCAFICSALAQQQQTHKGSKAFMEVAKAYLALEKSVKSSKGYLVGGQEAGAKGTRR